MNFLIIRENEAENLFMLHVATIFSLKQGETRTSHGPIPHPFIVTARIINCNSLSNYYLFTSGVWIGINDRDYEGEYEYADGYTRVNWFSWGPGLPNDNIDPRNQDCVETNYESAGAWNDVDCLETRRFICEY